MKTRLSIFIGFVLAILGITSVFLGAKANPDYICIKDVNNASCEITSCTEWEANGSRVCNGTRATQIAYYRTRTTCGAGRVTKAGPGIYTSGASGRKTSDFTYNSESCTVTQEDHEAPAK